VLAGAVVSARSGADPAEAGSVSPAAQEPASAGRRLSSAGQRPAPPYPTEPPVQLDPVPKRKATAWAHPARGVPQRIVVPELRIDHPVVGIDAPGGVLRPPDDPQVLGWWRPGARPGERRGSALVTGHTVSSGGGAFDDLETLQPGDRVVIRTTRGRIDYRVTGVTVYGKAGLARHAARVFSQTVPGRLVLITCEDWNGTEYLSNAVVTAAPVR
jgi:LPXTG-site transpeptidase (sortase) family protein